MSKAEKYLKKKTKDMMTDKHALKLHNLTMDALNDESTMIPRFCGEEGVFINDALEAVRIAREEEYKKIFKIDESVFVKKIDYGMAIVYDNTTWLNCNYLDSAVKQIEEMAKASIAGKIFGELDAEELRWSSRGKEVQMSIPLGVYDEIKNHFLGVKK